MTLEQRISALTDTISGVAHTLKANQGTMASLTTTDKSSLVAALNEVKALVGAGSITINDLATNTTQVWSSQKTQNVITAGLATKPSLNDSTTNTTDVWSGSKITSVVNAAITALINGAPLSGDTLKELADQIAANAAADAGAVSALATQSFTYGQKYTARKNIGVPLMIKSGDKPFLNKIHNADTGITFGFGGGDEAITYALIDLSLLTANVTGIEFNNANDDGWMEMLLVKIAVASPNSSKITVGGYDLKNVGDAVFVFVENGVSHYIPYQCNTDFSAQFLATYNA
jgi:hypothetical protein